MSNTSTVKWPNRTFYVVMFLLAIVEVVLGRFPTWPVCFVIGYLVWPRLEKLKSAAWSKFALFLFVAALFVISIAISIMLKPFGEQASDAVGDGIKGFIPGLVLRALLNKSLANTNQSVHSP